MRNREIIAEARYRLKGNFWRAVIIMFIVATIPAVINYSINGGVFIESIRGASGEGTTVPNIGTFILPGLVYLLIWVIASFLTIGEKWSYLHMVDNEKLRIKTIFESFTQRPGRNIWHNVLHILLIFFWMIVGMIGLGLLVLLANWLVANYGDFSLVAVIFTAFISFIIGLLALLFWFIAIRFWFILSEYILYEDQEISAYEALKFSRRLIKGNKWQLFTLTVRLFLPWVFLSVILPIVVVLTPLVIQDQIWIWGLIIAVSFLGYFIYTYMVQIRWKASLAVFYRMLLSESFDY